MNTPNQHHELNTAQLSAGVKLWLAVAWLWVGVPLVWGLTQTILKAAALFN